MSFRCQVRTKLRFSKFWYLIPQELAKLVPSTKRSGFPYHWQRKQMAAWWNLPAYYSTCWPPGSLRITVTITYFEARAGILVLLSPSHSLHTLNNPAQGFCPPPVHSPPTPATLDISFFLLISLCHPSSASLLHPSLLLVFHGQVESADHAHSTTFSFCSRLFQMLLVVPTLISSKTKTKITRQDKTKPFPLNCME